MKNSLIDVLSRAMTGVLLLQIPNLVRDDEDDFYTALREPQGPGVFVLRRDFFLFLADQYRAMEGDLATRRFPKGIYDPLKNPWRDFSRARQLQMQVPQKKILTLLQNHFVAGYGSFSDCLKAVVQVFHGKAFLHRLLRCLF